MSRPGRRHGRASTYGNGCRCGPCRDAWADKANHDRLARLRGQWRPWVDAGPVRDHVQALLAAGLTKRSLAAAAGVSIHTVTHLLGGTPSQGLRAPTQVRPATAARLQSVQPPSLRLPPAGMVEGTGTRRRLQALVVMGWRYTDLARQMGVPYPTVRNMTNGQGRVMARNAARAAAAYDALWNKAGPSDRARALAARNGWVPPLAWDDDRIDDPAARPSGVRQARAADADGGSPARPVAAADAGEVTPGQRTVARVGGPRPPGLARGRRPSAA